MGIEQRDPWGGSLTPDEEKVAAAKRRAAIEEGHGKNSEGVYDLDANGETGEEVKPIEEEDPESKKAA